MRRRSSILFHLLAVPAIVIAGVAVEAIPANAARATCGTVTIAKLNGALGIDAAHVTTVIPPKNPKALICSYYGTSGRAANEATINYLRTTAKSFAVLKASLATTHRIQTVTGFKLGAYNYQIGSERYLYVLNGTDQVQIFATVPLSKLEVLAHEMPRLS